MSNTKKKREKIIFQCPKKETNFYYNAQHFEIIKTNTVKASQYKINIDDFNVIVLIELNP
jgi:hypothetical protein